ncbi:mitotic fidelity of chromosome transmission- protein [Cladophialophora chaetospira]|uniref:CENP-C homolog n=1 Tax=Cladophialophora chaetospira TaxID=386627 RepID=A0AA38WVZ5_9EURO|nr:mitotic fidelity of chromosome transmission- protein [Cladophialophora chaetospira]
MAPQPAQRRGGKIGDYSAIGKQGRQTGVTLDQQPLDSYGIEQISGIFSSPRKSSPLKNMMVMSSLEETTPTQPLSARRSTRNTPARPPRSSSPRKSGISGAARKSNGVDIFATRASLQAEEFEAAEVVSEHVPTPVQITKAFQPQSTRSLQKSQARRFVPSPQKSPLRNTLTITPTRLQRPRASLGMQRIEDDVAPSIEDVDFDVYDEARQEVEAAAQSTTDNPNLGGEAAEATMTPRQRPVSEELGDPGLGFDDDETEPDPEIEPEAALPASQNKANSRKKRKSDAMELDKSAASPRAVKIPKKRGRPPVLRDMTPPAPSPKPLSAKAKGKQPLRNKDANLKLSSRQEKELEDIVEKVKARPGPPRSLHILRRETPADDSVTHTRSGRVSVRPLAYWRNERCVFGTSPGGASLADGARFPLNSIKEIVRTEEVAESLERKKSKSKKKGKGTKLRGKARQTSAEEEDSSDSDFDLDAVPVDAGAEPWETETGTLRGNVSIWDNADQAPTEQEEEVEIAHAPAAIKTREVKGSSMQDGPTFRYAKLLSTKFFGTGLVDLPPGGIKRPKNSRKMHMSFFVVKGRVTVTVGPLGGEDTGSMNRFSIGKGGFWQVPRGNQYSIENEMDKAARVFFSQGCEPEPEAEED